jgi:hypothetical protein
MKGIELTINTIIILIICLVVFLAVLALLLGMWNPNKESLSLETVKDNACQTLSMMSCNQAPKDIFIRDFDANKNGNVNDLATSDSWTYNDNCLSSAQNGDNLKSLCVCYYGLSSENDCKRNLCNCQ